MKIWSIPSGLLLLLLAVLAAGCQTPSIKEAAPRGAAAILEQLEARGEERIVALEENIRGAVHPRCSMKEAFLEARKKKPPSRVKLVERDILRLIGDDPRSAAGAAADEKTRLRLGELLSADTVVIGWAGENEELIFDEEEETGTRALKEKHWYTAYLHMVAIDIPSGELIAAWSHYPGMASSISRRICPWIRRNDIVVVQPTLDDEVKSALLAGLQKGREGRYSVVVRDLVPLLTGEKAPDRTSRSAEFFSLSNQNRLRESGVSVIVGADNAMGQNLRAVDIRSGEIIDGLNGPLSEHVKTAYDDPKRFSL